MLPDNFDEILNGKCYVVNMDRCIDRWPIIEERIRNAGFHPERMKAVDGLDQESCREQWRQFRSDVDRVWNIDLPGQAGCALSHINIWLDMIEKNLPYATILEDDVIFHKDWKQLAPMFYEKTDKNTHVMYYGSQKGGGDDKEKYELIESYPVFCTHAYLITQEGARILTSIFLHTPRLYAIDCLLIDLMKAGITPYTWQVWRALDYEDPARNNSIETRNEGLVFQDDNFPSFINPLLLHTKKK